jgi:uncharacterized membrane protein (DUF2068 family)
MGRRRQRWHPETLVCAFAGHETPALRVALVRGPDDWGVGVDLPDGRRFARCIRCDAWVVGTPPDQPAQQTLPPLDEVQLPRRGKVLRDAIVLRLIAVDRGLHAALFGLIAIGLLVLRLKLSVLKAEASDVLERLGGGVVASGNPGRDFLVRELHRLVALDQRGVLVALLIALGYMLVEGVEAVGLWRQRRWAEYLTVIATAGLVPLEVDELVKRVTVVRVGALVLNLAIVAWLLWAKRLFGLRGGHHAEEEALQAAELLAPPPAIEPRPQPSRPQPEPTATPRASAPNG